MVQDRVHRGFDVALGSRWWFHAPSSVVRCEDVWDENCSLHGAGRLCVLRVETELRG